MITKPRQRVLDLLKRHGVLSTSEIRDHINASLPIDGWRARSSYSSLVRLMQKDGQIVLHEKRGRQNYWKLP